MRVFVVISHLGGGGAEHVGVLLANGLAKRGHQVVIATDLKKTMHYIPNTKVNIVDFVRNSKCVFVKWFFSIFILRKLLKKEKPDIIIGIMQLCSFVSKLSSLGMSIPVIMTEHNAFERPEESPFTRIESISKFQLNKIYSLVTVLTQADKDVIDNRFKNIAVMSNPLAFNPIDFIPLKQRTVLAIGRLDAWYVKGFDVLIKAFSKLVYGYDHSGHDFCRDSDKQASLMAFTAPKIQSEGWKLQIAGTGSEKSLNYLKQLCKENGIEDSVEFIGFQKDVEKLYREASIFVLSSRYEGFGLVLIEAMSQGCACIACDYKGRQKEILCPNGQVSSSKFQVQSLKNGVEICENGILCEPDNVDALAEAINRMMTDDDYRELVRISAVERSKFYSLENTMDRWEHLLNQLVNK